MSIAFRFPYISGRPEVVAKIWTDVCSKHMGFLVDSGADYSLLSASNAFLLGLEYRRIEGPEMIAEAADNSRLRAKKTKVGVKICGYSFEIPILITEKEVDNLFGRKGFFEFFDILFQERMNQMVFMKI